MNNENLSTTSPPINSQTACPSTIQEDYSRTAIAYRPSDGQTNEISGGSTTVGPAMLPYPTYANLENVIGVAAQPPPSQQPPPPPAPVSMGGGGIDVSVVGGMVAGYRVPTEFGGTLKSSKGSSAVQSPRKSTHNHGNLCDCFGGGDSGGGRSGGGRTKAARKSNSRGKSTNVWPTVLANMGICALLLGYIFLGSFIFLTIENSGPSVDIPAGASSDTAAIWHISQMPKKIPTALPQQQQQHHQQQSVMNIETLTNYREHSSSSASSVEELKYSRLLNGSAHQVPLTAQASTQKQMPSHNYANGDYVVDDSDDDVAVRDESLLQQDQQYRHEEDLERQRTVENIWDITVSLNILYKENWTKLASLEIAKFQNQLVKRLVTDLVNDGHSHGLHNTHQHNYQPALNLWQLREQRHRMREQQQEQFKWTFATAFLYSLTVITTVGYGTITPRTTLGRMMTIGYATFGIPLTLIYLSTIGGTLARLAQPLCTRLLCCCFCRRHSYCGRGGAAAAASSASSSGGGGGGRKQQVSDKKCNLPLKQLHHSDQPYCYVRPPPPPPLSLSQGADISSVSGGLEAATASASFDTLSIATTTTTTTHNTTTPLHQWSLVMPVALCLLLLCLYVGFGSLVIALLEHWSLLDGVYFCFMSLTTIGFCDLLPGLGGSPGAGGRGVAVWFCAVYILSGLTLTSMCVNLLHEEILQRMRVVVTVQTRNSKDSSNNYREKERGFYSAKP